MGIRGGLLGSTALAAVAISATDSQAEDGVKLSIGGYYHAAAGAVIGEDFGASSGVSGGDVRDYVFKQKVDLNFNGETTLDNGLTVGASVWLRGQTNPGDQIKKVYAYFSGGFGKVQFGDQDGALAAMCYTVPSASQIFGADSPAVSGFNFSNAGIAGYGATNGTCYGIDSYSTQLVYFSPDLSGFQFGLSFTPDQTEDTRNVLDGAGTRLRNDAHQNSENLSVAAIYSHDFSDIKLTLGGGHTWSFNKEANPNNTDRARTPMPMPKSALPASRSAQPLNTARISATTAPTSSCTVRASPTTGTPGPSASAGRAATTRRRSAKTTLGRSMLRMTTSR